MAVKQKVFSRSKTTIIRALCLKLAEELLIAKITTRTFLDQIFYTACDSNTDSLICGVCGCLPDNGFDSRFIICYKLKLKPFSLFVFSAGAGASWRPCDSTFRGSNAFSEVETRNVRRYLETLQQLKGFIDFHAYSQMWFIPWGYTQRDTDDHKEQV